MIILYSRKLIIVLYLNILEELYSRKLIMISMTTDSGDYLRMYFIMDKCDPPGVFRCEALIKSYNIRSHEVPLYGEFKAGETSDGRMDPKCIFIYISS